MCHVCFPTCFSLSSIFHHYPSIVLHCHHLLYICHFLCAFMHITHFNEYIIFEVNCIVLYILYMEARCLDCSQCYCNGPGTASYPFVCVIAMCSEFSLSFTVFTREKELTHSRSQRDTRIVFLASHTLTTGKTRNTCRAVLANIFVKHFHLAH